MQTLVSVDTHPASLARPARYEVTVRTARGAQGANRFHARVFGTPGQLARLLPVLRWTVANLTGQARRAHVRIVLAGFAQWQTLRA